MHRSICRHFDVIDHNVHWLAASRKAVHGGVQERLGLQATD
ncbi:MAG: hypothetical protein OXS50_12585 [Gammaproteobacteria bacterium]|nr:hypothetical protein [Gammaproteobacteria bacterium]